MRYSAEASKGRRAPFLSQLAKPSAYDRHASGLQSPAPAGSCGFSKGGLGCSRGPSALCEQHRATHPDTLAHGFW